VPPCFVSREVLDVAELASVCVPARPAKVGRLRLPLKTRLTWHNQCHWAVANPSTVVSSDRPLA